MDFEEIGGKGDWCDTMSPIGAPKNGDMPLVMFILDIFLMKGTFCLSSMVSKLFLCHIMGTQITLGLFLLPPTTIQMARILDFMRA